MCRTHAVLYTKVQLQGLFNAWECTEPIPKKGQKVLIAWPCKGELEADVVEVEWTDLKGTYGDKLYRVTYSSRAGRAFDAELQESHVRAFLSHLAEQHRLQNLARHTALLS